MLPVPDSLSEWQRRWKLRAWKPEHYEKLADSRSTRVIVLAPGSAADYIQCSLRTISLDNPDANFEALSYRWGLKAPRFIKTFFSICLDGHRFDVTYNLYYALRNLRDPVQEKVVWIDAICINQADVEERGQQVKLMGYIYSKAEQVVIDLGFREDTQCVRTAMSFLLRAWQQEDPQDWLEKTLGRSEFTQDWISMSSLLTGEYWTRIWIIQEVGLAKQLKVYCQGEIVQWDALCLVHRVWHAFKHSIATTTDRDLLNWYIDVQSHYVRIINRRWVLKQSSNPLSTLHALDRKMNGPWPLQENIKTRQKLGEPTKLLDLLGASDTSFSTNPRDKIYGLLGLVNDHDVGNYKVDYASNQRSVLQYLVQHMIDSTKRLDILCYASFHKGLPSWVPYWGPVTLLDLTWFAQYIRAIPSSFWRKLPLRFPGQRRLQSFAPLRHAGLDSSLRRITTDEDFTAAGNTDAEAHIEEIKGRNPILVAAGCVVDEIVEILNPPNTFRHKKVAKMLTGAPSPRGVAKTDAASNAFTGYDDHLATPSTWLSNELDIVLSNQLKQMLAKFLHTPSTLTGEAKLLAFLQAITYDRTHSGEAAGTTYLAPFQVLTRNFTQTPTSTASPSSTRQLTEDDFQRSEEFVHDLLHRVHEVFEIPVGQLCRTRRRLYITKRGLIGLGEPYAKEGDLVCVIKGCFRPILVKRKRKGTDNAQDEGDNVVRGVSHGCTFLHGYMEGRAIEEMEKGLLEACTFRLE